MTMTQVLGDTAVPTQSLYLRPDLMMARRGEIPCLDGFRAISISIVLLGHLVSPVFPGGIGVIVFFIISGFLITRLMIAEARDTGAVRLSDFYMRRILRLYPVIVVFAIVMVIAATLKGRSYTLMEPISALFYFANYYYSALFATGARETLPFTIFWSLSIEEHFYLLFPLAFVLLRSDIRRLTILMAIVVVGCLFLRLIVASLHPELVMTQFFYSRSEFRLDSIATGVLIALFCESEVGRRLLLAIPRPSCVIASALTLLICLTIRNPWFRETIRYTLLDAALSGLIIGILFSSRYRAVNQLLNSRPMIWLGRHSYSIYVWHLGVAFLIGAQAFHVPLRWILEFGATLCVAVLSFNVIEQPFMRLRHKFGSKARS